MIDVKSTINKTIKDYIDKLRFLGDNNPKSLSKILYLIVLDDVYQWSVYKGIPDLILRKLRQLRTDFILNNGEFIIERMKETFEAEGNTYILKHLQPYVNVNTPQSNDTWKRVWDAPEENFVEIDVDIQPEQRLCEPFELDLTCKTEIVYYINAIDPSTGEPALGAPNNIDVANLSICQKMNVFINREDNTAWYLDNLTCQWKQLNVANGVTSQQVIDLINAKRQGINAVVDDLTNLIKYVLTDPNGSREEAHIPTATDQELEDLL